MSLITDKVFYRALKSNAELVGAVGNRIENTYIPVPDEDYLNEPLPFIIVTYDGMQNEGLTKDNSYEGDTDRVQIGIDVAAENRDELGMLTNMVRETIIQFFENYEAPTDPTEEDLSPLIPEDYQIRASAVGYNSVRPCYYQTLSYNCDTTP